MPKALTDITTREVSLVTRGAVGKRFAVTKEDAMPIDQILKAVLEKEAEGEAAFMAALHKSDLSEQGAEAMRGVYRLLTVYRDEIPADVVKAAPKMAGYPNDDAHEYAEDGGKGKFPGKKKAKAKKAGAAMPDDDGDADGDDDGDDGDEDHKFPPSKKKKAKACKSADVPEEFRAQFEAIEKAQAEAVEKAAALERQLQAERDVRLNKEFVEKAEREFKSLGAPSEVGPVLKSLSGADPKLAGQIEKLLKTASERIRMGDLFGQRGADASMNGAFSGDGTPGSVAWQKIEKLADGLVQKDATGKTSRAQAIDIVLKRHPELYHEYTAERQAAGLR